MNEQPRLVIAGLRGGSGKTLVSLGLARVWKDKGIQVKPFKKGPDYIDAAWLSKAAGYIASNLDPFLMSEDTLKGLFWHQVSGFDIGLIEGNRGLFDGKDIDGSCSTAYLAKVLQSPVLLIVDCTKMTRTIVALIQGCKSFEQDLNLAGVVFNRTAGARHRNILHQCVEEYTDLPVLGALPKLENTPIPERHMGLISDQEYASTQPLEEISKMVAESLDTDKIFNIACSASKIEKDFSLVWPESYSSQPGIKIGYVRDCCLWFYYPENLEALQRAGAELVEVSLLDKAIWPEIHGLYLGGGFPETQAKAISENIQIRRHVYRLACQGMPIYAECGGLMYLCTVLHFGDQSFPMAGVFPMQAEVNHKPQGHGYTLVKVIHANPFHPLNVEFCGHEFHYSRCKSIGEHRFNHCLGMLRGTGLGFKNDGLIFKNSFACYTHIHALSVPSWAENFVRAAEQYKSAMDQKYQECPTIVAK